MFEILTVCTGNICRSPLAEQLLRARLSEHGVMVSSAGTRGLRSAPMTPEAERLALTFGVAPEDAASHRSRFLTPQMLETPALILTMTRQHRSEVVQLAPKRLRSTLTIREFARLSASMTTEQLRDSASGTTASERVRAMAVAVATRRGLALPPDDPTDDDVIDPYGRPYQVYERSAAELQPAVEAVVRAVNAVLS